MSKGKILHISKFYPPYKGGIEDVCHSIVNSLQGYEHKVICFSEDKESSVTKETGVEIYRIGTLTQWFSQPIAPKFKKNLEKIIKEFNPDIVHLHTPNPYSSIIAEISLPKKVKLIVHWHSDIIEQKFIYRLFKPFEKRLLQRADRIFVTSPNYQEHSTSLQPFYNKITVVPNGISLEKMALKENDALAIQKIKEKYGNKKIIFFMGRHVPYKGIEKLIEAEKNILSDCVILIAGKGPLTEKLKCANKSPRIHFIGEILDEEVRIYMSAASVLAFPSLTKNEAFGIVLAEAMYCKTPPVLFTIPGSGVNWLNIKDKTGIEVTNADVIEFGKAIDMLLSNEDLRLKFGENAYRRIEENFTIDRVKLIIDKEYELLIKNTTHKIVQIKGGNRENKTTSLNAKHSFACRQIN